MVKTKFQTLSKEEKKKAVNEYFETEAGRELKSRLTRLLIYGIILIALGIYLIVDAVLANDSTMQVLYGTGLIVVAFVFIIGRHYALIKHVNSYIVKQKKKK